MFNGDMGVITEINEYTETIEVEFDESRKVKYGFDMTEELELAYAITVHKSQGSEYPAVIIPLLPGPKLLYNRNLLYTADESRAKKCLTIVGSEAVFQERYKTKTNRRGIQVWRNVYKNFKSLYPKVCPFCGEISPEGVCAECKKKIIYVRQPRCMRCGKPIKDEYKEYCSDCAKRTSHITQGRSLWLHKEPVSRRYINSNIIISAVGENCLQAEMAQAYKDQVIKWGIEEITPFLCTNLEREKEGIIRRRL